MTINTNDTFPTDAKLHVHVWDQEAEDIVVEADAPLLDAYPVFGTDDAYFQFGVTMPDGKWLELRLSFKDLGKMADWMVEYSKSGNN